MGQTIGWARIWYAVKHDDDVTLRQGAWYPVLNTAPTRVELDVSGHRVTVPHDVIELRPRRPDRFTVVYRTWNDPNPAQGTKADVGRTYAVCPQCASRVRLPKLPRLGTSGVMDASLAERARCPKCGHEGTVAWWETG
jgi:DNA-directed RNA polymerase subunit RPC12/RpoP